ncbi:Bug family tripartite tricarboxylate transporter substrate binding protein [Roseomonas xinghualingensis]|uniref:Bug family tripartite tricarboxylate transporter substrate binding protein n=1 Tax=Roseomonas xinghualingensis TaxID=2986475 RepID=UPI0021F1A778|nr:tripartite tricarboxylate transporter substrate binding protein [Roseomonas sp. SXEYE001]MCV4209691.1 tripartite tricarboxylate transporter substrate binding protein [Roseomonas sp. SXEYE001]
MRITRRAMGLGLAALHARGAMAQSTYPSRPINWIVPFTPAGITDINSRLFARKLGARLGQTVLIDNRPGAGGTLGTEVGARATPDGYTMMYGTQGTLCTAPSLFRRLPYDPIRSFVPIQGLFETPSVVVVHPSRPYRTVEELIAYAKANPGKVNFATSGVGTGTHLATVLFQTVAGIEMTHVPYPGSGPALTDLIAGTTDIMFDYAVATREHIQGGRLRPLVVTARERIPVLPDVPTMVEMGMPDAVSAAWSGILLPAGAPADVVEKLAAECAATIQDPEIRHNAESNGSRPMAELSRDSFARFIEAEIPRWADIVRRSGAQPS